MSRATKVLLCIVIAWVTWVGAAFYILSQRSQPDVWYEVPEG